MNQYFYARDGGGPGPMDKPIRDLRHMDDHVTECLMAEQPFAQIKRAEDAALLGKAGSSSTQGKQLARAIAQRHQHIQVRAAVSSPRSGGDATGSPRISYGTIGNVMSEDIITGTGRRGVGGPAAGGGSTRRRVPASEATAAEKRMMHRAAYPNERPLFYSGGPQQYSRTYDGLAPFTSSVLYPDKTASNMQTKSERKKQIATLYTAAADAKAPSRREINHWCQMPAVQSLTVKEVRALQQPELEKHERRLKHIRATHDHLADHHHEGAETSPSKVTFKIPQRPATAGPTGGKAFRQASAATLPSPAPAISARPPPIPRPSTCGSLRKSSTSAAITTTYPAAAVITSSSSSSPVWSQPKQCVGKWMANDAQMDKKAFESVASRRDELIKRRLFNVSHINIHVNNIQRCAALSSNIEFSKTRDGEMHRAQQTQLHHSKVAKLKRQARRRKAIELLVTRINSSATKEFKGVGASYTRGDHLYFIRDGKQLTGKELNEFLSKTLDAHEKAEAHRTRPMSASMKSAIIGMSKRLNL